MKHSIPVLPFLRRSAAAAARAAVALLAPVLALCALALPARAQETVTIPRPDPSVAEFARGVKFTVNGYQGGTEVQTNFPVLVRLSTAISGFTYSDFYADGSDLSLVDIGFVDAAGNGLAYDIDTWNPSGESLVWVSLPRMTNGTEFAMWYRSSKTGKELNPTNAWAGYTGVWHLNESGANGTTVKDSSTNALDCTAQEHSASVAAGKIGGSWRISDVYDRKAAGLVVDASVPANNAALNALGSTFHVSFWFKTTSTGNSAKWCALIGRRGSGSDAGWALQLHDTWNQLRVYGNGGEKNAYKQIGAMNNLAADTWAKIDVVWYADNNGKGRATTFYNGSQIGDNALWNNENAVSQIDNLDFVIGNFANTTSDRGLYGVMDEVRLGSGKVSAARVKADYDTVNTAAFLTAGSVVEVAVVERPVANLQVADTGASHVQFGNAISSLGSSDATECTFNVKVWKTAESEPAGYTALATGLTVGALTGRVKGLTPETAYSYKIKVTNDENVDSDEVTGAFTTSGVGVGGTGGDMTRVGDDWIHYFRVGFDEHGGITNDYVFTPPSYATAVRALVVGGGGPGGYYAGGGGGAGGYYYNETLGVTPGTGYAVHVGAGGVAATSATAYGSNGGDSSIVGGTVNVVMLGGGAGGNGRLNNQTATRAGQNGGSGGGTAWTGCSTGSGTADQGHDGGDVPAGQYQQDLAAGGGGAAAVGGSVEFSSNEQTKGSGTGGNGRSCDITGEPLHYAGGGSGGAKLVTNQNGTGTAGAAGSGGGGKGGQYDNTEGSQYATAGADGFGGGGGGGSTYSQDSYQGGNGGDGIVIIRYEAKGDGTDVTAPAIALESLDRTPQTGVTTVGYRVAWAGAGYDDADVAIVWGFRKDELSNTNAIASSMIGRGTGTFTLPDQTKTVYVRALATNGGGLSAESPKIVKISFVDPEAPEVALPVVSNITGTGASFSVVVLGLGEGATSVDGVFQVCTDEDFEGTILSFPADAALSAAGSLAATATGLAPNTPYYVRVSATNDVPDFFETEPTHFRTGIPGPPSGLVVTANPPAGAAVPAVTTTTIEAWGKLASPGDNGATHANLCLEASMASDFASVDATSATTNGLVAGECAPFRLTGLEPDTAYYLRLHMENDGRVVAHSAVVGPFTTLPSPVSLTIPDLTSYHVSLVSVTTNGVAIEAAGGVYTVYSNATVTVTFAAAEGYRLAGDATVTVVMDANKTLTGIPTAELIPSPTATATLTIPEPPANVTLVSVTTNGVAVAGNASVYTVYSNATVTVTFAAAEGYRLAGGATVTVVVDGDKTLATADMPTAEALPPPTVSQSATKVFARKTVTLTASAEGATSYYWLKNGVVIEGGANGTLTVNWRSPENDPIDTYQAVAVYDIDGLPVESQPSEEMTVENRPMPTLLLIKGKNPPAPPVEHDYSADYLTFRVLTSGTISWKSFGSQTNIIEYSIDNGAWTSLTATPEGATLSVAQGNLVRFRGINTTYAKDKNNYSGFEGGTATYDIEGNIMSLLYGDAFAESTTLPNASYIFCSLFKKAPVVSAERLVLPATTLKEYCYRALFSWCTTLTKAPELPATTLAKGCYWYMFEQCAITEAPVLNATTLVAECYGHMFTDCGLLNRITCRATSGFNTSNCLAEWVKNVAGDGVFVKAANVTSWTTGVSGIPTGWIVCEDVLLLPPEVSFYGDTIELECPTEGAEIHYRLGQTGGFALYTGPVSIVGDTVVEAYSTYQGHTSQTVTQTCVYVHETPFERSNKDLTTWRYNGNTITTPYSVNGIDGHSSSYSKGTFAFDTSITLREKQPTYLWFQHADQSADIYVDGVKVGTHWGGYNAFFFDISEYVHRGQNDIRVALCNTTRSTLAPAAGDFNFNATLGNVKLFTSPVLPAMEYGYDGFHITSTVSASSATTNATIYVETKVPVGASLKCIISDDSYAWTNTLASTGREQTFTNTISNAHLWHGTIDPHLYTVTLEIYKDGDLYHKYQRPYGFRYYQYVINDTTVIPGQSYTGFLLNGRPYQLRGVCMHDDVEGKANALDDSDYDQEFAIIRELGCNFIRLAHYPHPKEVYDRCDQLGIVVQTEVPCVNKLQTSMPDDYYTHLTTQYTEMVQQHYNHPCIVFWGLSNETTTESTNEAKDFAKEKIDGYYDLIKELDSERLVGYVMSHSVEDPSGYYNDPDVDWFGCNIYVGWYIDKTKNDPSSRLNTRLTKTLTRLGKPLAFSEYGCGGTQHCHSEDFKSTTTTGNYARHDIEYQMWLHEGHIAAIRNYPQLLFTSQWQLFDIAVSSRNEGYTECLDGANVTTNDVLRRLNNKGLVERDHVTKKDTFYIYKAEWNPDPFVHICGKDYTKTTGRVLKCYTNDGDTLSLYVGDSETPRETVHVVDHIAVFSEMDFPSGVEIRVKGAKTSDTVTFQ